MFAHLTAEARRVMQQAFDVEPDIRWTVPREEGHGDASTSIALQLAKECGKPPRDIAQTLADALGQLEDVERAEVAGAGYVNVWLTPEALLRELEVTREARLGHKPSKKSAPVIIEYSQPNIAKPLGIHHILSTVIGQALCNMYRHAGRPVVAWNYIGDWGTQFGKLAVAYEKWGKAKKAKDYSLDELLDLYVRFHEEAEGDPALDAAGREAFRKLEEGDKKLRAFWKDVVAVTKTSLQDIYDRLQVSFDTDLGESFYEDKMQAVLEEGINKGIFTEGEGGALIVEFPEESGMPPFLVRKADGATLYATRDLAQIRYRTDTHHPAAILHVVDTAQQLYFRQLFATAELLGWNLPPMEHVYFGRMRFADKAMSTRKGNILKLEHVLDEAVERAKEVVEEHRETIQTDDQQDLAEMMGIGALVYGILSQNRKMELVFDWKKMLSFEGNSAPYVQYTHARARSVLRKAEEDAADVPPRVELLTAAERLLIKTLLVFPEVLHDARESHMPHKLAHYLYQLSQDFNAFYNTDPILKAEGTTRRLRLALSDLTSSVLKTGAGLLTLRVPERM